MLRAIYETNGPGEIKWDFSKPGEVSGQARDGLQAKDGKLSTLKLPKGLKGNLVIRDLESLTAVDTGENDFNCLTFENLPKLGRLVIQNMVKENLSFNGTPALKNLRFKQSRLSGFEAFSGLASLKILSLEYCQIADYSGLAKLTGLTALDIIACGFSDLSPLALAPQLKELCLASNGISDLGGLASLSGLLVLSIQDNAITDLTPLAGLSGLTHLALDQNAITDLTPLAGLRNLEFLNLPANKVATVDALVKLDKLQFLDLLGNPVTDLSPLQALPLLSDLRAPEGTALEEDRAARGEGEPESAAAPGPGPGTAPDTAPGTVKAGAAPPVQWAPGPDVVQIDLEKTALTRYALYLDRPSAALESLAASGLLAWLEARIPEYGAVLRAVMEAKIADICVQGVGTGGDILLAVHLPEGNLAGFETGDLSAQTFAAAFGEKGGALLFPQLQAIPAEDIKADVRPGVHQLDVDFFVTASGKHLVAATTPILAQAGKNKIRTGKNLVDAPEPRPQFWLRNETAIHCKPTGQEAFTRKTMQSVFTVRRANTGWDFTNHSNIADILPAFGDVTAVDARNLPLFGSGKPVLALALSGGLLQAVRSIGLKGYEGALLDSALADLPFDPATLERILFVMGGPRGAILGLDVPGVYLGATSSGDGAETLRFLAQKVMGGAWEKREAQVWDALSVSGAAVVDGAPVPASLVAGRKGNTVVFGLIKPEGLDPFHGEGGLLFPEEADGKASAWQILDFTALWAELRLALRPGAPLRAMLDLDKRLSPEAVGRLETLLALEFPLGRLVQHTGRNAGLSAGRLEENPASSGFLEALCAFLDAFMPADPHAAR
ncbi:leucine-rich repeat domain-containing protein [Desulfovibrio sp. OttesenSCG-928-C14]|nr:leucine-rich repeat domain-containing protein [Desulfovibrio sp. OttesenSCG-928-C14]